MKHIFIVNPKSGKNKKVDIIATIEEVCHEKELDFEVLITQYSGHASLLAAQYSIKDNVCIYSVGGDGTAYEILNGLNDKVEMAIIPCGTGNDFYRMIARHKPTSFKRRVIEAIDGESIELDYGVVNNKRFLNCTTIGFDAQINHYSSTKLRGTFIPSAISYLVAALSQIVNSKPLTLTISTDDETWTQDVLLCAIMNGRYYGGGFIPTPNAELQDGYFDVCVINYMSRTEITKLINKYMKGKHTELPVCKMFKAKKVTLESKSIATLQSDGECFNETHIHMEIMHNALKLKVPSRSQLKES